MRGIGLQQLAAMMGIADAVDADAPAPIAAICRQCAEKRGWEPVDFPVGTSMGECEVCGKLRHCTAARDYRYDPERNPFGR